MEVTPAMFAHFINLLKPLAEGKLCVIQEVKPYMFGFYARLVVFTRFHNQLYMYLAELRTYSE